MGLMLWAFSENSAGARGRQAVTPSMVIGACVLAAVVTYVLSLAVARVSRRVT